MNSEEIEIVFDFEIPSETSMQCSIKEKLKNIDSNIKIDSIKKMHILHRT